jgi:predicted regulator of Ras-like GTPase activity (Roadblock/LC7/MglB family)
MVSRVDAAAALADLTEISSHVEAAAIVGEDGEILAATPGDERLAAAGLDLLRVAGERLGGEPTQLEAALREGSVFVHRDGDRAVVARTGAHPPSALVLHDLAATLARA